LPVVVSVAVPEDGARGVWAIMEEHHAMELGELEAEPFREPPGGDPVVIDVYEEELS
jgi:hypothetical protein